MPLFGLVQHLLHQIGTTVLFWFWSLSKVLIPTENRRIQGLFKVFTGFSSTFQDIFNFEGLFKTVLYIQVLFKPVWTLNLFYIFIWSFYGQFFMTVQSPSSKMWVIIWMNYSNKLFETCDFQQCGIEPVQPPFKLRNSKLCLVSSLTIIEYSRDQQRPWSGCAYAQADLRLCWSHIPHCWKSHALAHL